MGHEKFAEADGSLTVHLGLGMLRISVPLCILFLLSSASAQNNLVKNPSAEEGLKFWRVFGNASASDCLGVGKCFSVNQDAFVFQDIDVPESAAGRFALFISFAAIEKSYSPKTTGQPYLHGYFMTSGELRKAILLANLSGQEMTHRPNANGEWVKEFGVFLVPERTGRIRIFMRSGCGKTEPSSNCTSHFRNAGVFLFETEDEAKAFVASYQ
jgi:hypothetical protein